MDAAKIVKSSQEQAAAAWIDYLNQLRLTELLKKLSAQDANWQATMEQMRDLKASVQALLQTNRGGTKGIHGFLAETMEAHIVNARNLVNGAKPEYVWVNDNGTVDLIRNGVAIQQKFSQFGGHFGLEAVAGHLKKYPDFVRNGGKYQLPKDFYEEMRRLLSLSPEEAGKLPNKDWTKLNKVREILSENHLSLTDFEPSVENYADVQRGKIYQTIRKEEVGLRETDQRRRDAAYEASKPSWKQAAQVTAGAAAMEGGVNFCLGIHRKLKSGKRLHDFTASDWKDVGIDTTKGAAGGGIRGAVVYGMTNFTATPAAVANALVTAAYGVAGQAIRLRRGDLSEEEFIVNSEVLCLDASMSAVSALMGQTLIPVPVLGAIIGNAAGMFLYGIAKENLSSREQRLIERFNESMDALNWRLEERYQRLVAELKQEFAKFSSALELAFSPDVNLAFDGSVKLAEYVGVPQEKILRNKRDIDNFFLS